MKTSTTACSRARLGPALGGDRPPAAPVKRAARPGGFRRVSSDEESEIPIQNRTDPRPVPAYTPQPYSAKELSGEFRIHREVRACRASGAGAGSGTRGDCGSCHHREIFGRLKTLERLGVLRGILATDLPKLHPRLPRWASVSRTIGEQTGERRLRNLRQARKSRGAANTESSANY